MARAARAAFGTRDGSPSRSDILVGVGDMQAKAAPFPKVASIRGDRLVPETLLTIAGCLRAPSRFLAFCTTCNLGRPGSVGKARLLADRRTTIWTML
jgi:hypothetical protein